MIGYSLRRFILIGCIASLMGLLFLNAAGAQEKKLIVSSIKIKGNWTVETLTIRNYIKVQVGDPFDFNRLRQDMQAIYASGFFQDVKIDVEKKDGGALITFLVQEKPTIKEIEISGYDEISAEKIREKIEFKTSSVLDDTAIAKSIREIKKLYQDDGYYLVEVDVEKKLIPPHWVRLKYNINEGPEVKIAIIDFDGNEAFTDDELQKTIETRDYWFFSWLTGSGHLNKETLDLDLERLLTHYYDNGYIDVQVGSPEVKLSEDKTKLDIKIPINEGPQYNVGEIEISGNKIISTEKITRGLTLKTGEIFSRQKLREDITKITEGYADGGYLLTEALPLVKRQPDKQIVNLVIKINEGGLTYVHRVRILGNNTTRDKVIRRELEFKEGDVLTGRAIRRSYQDLNNLGFFETVDIKTNPTDSENNMDVDVMVKEKLTGSLSVGAGWSSVYQLMGNVSITQGNLFGRGQRLRLSGSLGQTRQRYNLGFTEPWLFDMPLTAGADIYYRTRSRVRYRDYRIDYRGGKLNFGYPLFERVKGYASYMYEDRKIYDIKSNAPESIKNRKGTSATSEISFSLLRDSRNNRWRPSRGARNKLSVEYAGGMVGGDNYYIRYLAESSWHFPIWWKFVLSFHGLIGYQTGYNGHNIPVEELFAVGGAQTVRGYDRDAIGPRKGSYVIGGNKKLVFNAEFHFPIIEPVTGLFFFDTGGAFAESENYELDEMRMGVGAGIRFFTPMGPIRLDWGYKLDRKEEEDSAKWHFAIGTYF